MKQGQSERSEKAKFSNSLRVLIFEDSPIHQYLAHCVLKNIASHVSVFENGEDGLIAASTERFDFVIVDMGLPDITGDIVIKRLRAIAGYDNVPVIINTASPETFTEQIQQSKADAVMAKPLTQEAIIQYLKRFHLLDLVLGNNPLKQ